MSSLTVTAPAEAEPLTNKKIWSLYLPLALSWLFMAAESPICLAVISRLDNAKVNTAAFQLLLPLAIFIESPVIDLLSTSTTLGKSKQAYRVLTRFALIMMTVVTVVHAIACWTPLWGVITNHIIKVDPAVADAALWPMRIMTFWSACVGWRRYLQGIMIRAGVTRPIGFGTLVRVMTVGITGLILYFTTKMDGLVIASIGLALSVFAECMFIHFASKDVVHRVLVEPDSDSHITLGDLFKFHLPLTASTMVMLAGGPTLSWALSKSIDGVTQMAAWQIAFSLLWMFRTVTFALPEAVIALNTGAPSRKTLLLFCLQIGSGCSLLMVAFHLTGLDKLWFGNVLGAKAELIPLAAGAFFMNAVLPLTNAMGSCFKGFLTSAKQTPSRLVAIVIGVVTYVTLLVIGVQRGWDGIVNGTIATVFGQGIELLALVVAWVLSSRVIAKRDQEALQNVS